MAIDWTKSNAVHCVHNWQKLAMHNFDPTSAFRPELTLRIMDDLSRRHNCQAAAQGVNTLANNATRAVLLCK
jgi:hypothetical protein